MSEPKRSDSDAQLAAREMRKVAIVIAVTALLWLLGQAVGGLFGLEGRYAFLFDFAAIAAFFWAIVIVFQNWRKGRW